MRFLILTGSLLVAVPLTFATADESKPIQIGMVKTFFQGVSKPLVKIATDPFKDVVKKIMELEGDIIPVDDAFTLADKLEQKQVSFGIFHGHEFAWVKDKHPQFQPFMIAIGKVSEDRAYVIVHKNSEIKTVADLRGKKVVIPLGKHYARLFAERLRDSDTTAGSGARDTTVKSATPEEVLDDVIREKVQAAVVDAYALEFYKEIKGPHFAKHLRILHQSEVFPPPVLVYRQGNISEEMLTRFRDGLRKAPETNEGRDLMKLWQIQAFQPVPSDYANRLAEVLRAFPPPTSR